MNELNLIDHTISQLMKLLLQTYFFTVIQRKVHQRIAKFCRVQSNILLQQTGLMNHSPKVRIYMHALCYMYSYILTICYM